MIIVRSSRLWIVCVALMSLAACDPGGAGDPDATAPDVMDTGVADTGAPDSAAPLDVVPLEDVDGLDAASTDTVGPTDSGPTEIDIVACTPVGDACVAPVWTARAPATSPPDREGYAVAYDAARGHVLLVGGYSSEYGGLADTWTWDGASWAVAPSAVAPTARMGHAMVYDAVRARVVMFGGSVLDDAAPTNEPVAETWEHDGVDWIRVTPSASPPARTAHGMAYDAARGRVVMYGGQGAADLEDTWEYDGVTWTEVSPEHSPGIARVSAAMAYDAGRERVVLFGIFDPYPTPDDRTTWEYDGVDWAESVEGPFNHSRRQAMVYDAARSRVVLLGTTTSGLRSLDVFETWEYDGAVWVEAPSAPSPPKRAFVAAAYDSVREVTVLVAGPRQPEPFVPGALVETWEYGPPDEGL